MLHWKQINKRRLAAWISGSLALVFAVGTLGAPLYEPVSGAFVLFFGLTALFGFILPLFETGAEEAGRTGFVLIVGLGFWYGLFLECRKTAEGSVRHTGREHLHQILI